VGCCSSVKAGICSAPTRAHHSNQAATQAARTNTGLQLRTKDCGRVSVFCFLFSLSRVCCRLLTSFFVVLFFLSFVLVCFPSVLSKYLRVHSSLCGLYKRSLHRCSFAGLIVVKYGHRSMNLSQSVSQCILGSIFTEQRRHYSTLLGPEKLVRQHESHTYTHNARDFVSLT
jgi:hypothetical protein